MDRQHPYGPDFGGRPGQYPAQYPGAAGQPGQQPPYPGPPGMQPQPQHPGTWTGQNPGQSPHPGQSPYTGRGPQQPAAPRGPNLVDHLKRLVGLGGMAVSPREQQQLSAARIAPGRLQNLLVWRRSVLMIVLPVLIVTAVLGVYDAAEQGIEGMTAFGALLLWLAILSVFALVIAAGYTIVRWTDLRRSTRVLVGTWAVSMILAVLPAVFPLGWIYDFHAIAVGDAVQLTDPSGAVFWVDGDVAFSEAQVLEAREMSESMTRIMATMVYTVVLLPVIIGLVGGALRGARRAKAFFPGVTLPGWFVVVVAPFYSIVLLTIFSVISAVYGGGLLTFGVLLVAIAPLVFLWSRRLFVSPLSQQDAAALLSRPAIIAQAISGVGLVLVVIYMFVAAPMGIDLIGVMGSETEPGAWISYTQAIKAVMDLFGRFHLTSVVLALVFAQLAFRDWRMTTTMDTGVRAEHDREMTSLAAFDAVSRPAAAPVQTAEGAGPAPAPRSSGHMPQPAWPQHPGGPAAGPGAPGHPNPPRPDPFGSGGPAGGPPFPG